ncbi:MAG: hypothetical protein A3J93_04350 [Candidatus Magasanikbacteria bacterium RIFOXYC2_FULL_42_28]|uniref:Clp R domain-containing protein n=1 Tax=Candidatus Magasanikbacteria bacterium RIFOXYC2_FULL_42_28 TaxID=1798704 RepID=A0A1F6NX04_9BACT|nr:MAG: hypothetical protein A3J93_04350 [Candidatus Magasanikbacteria bacterium RIFOXYC2_FULL_42_28]
MFEKQPSLNLVTCPDCQSTGTKNFLRCSNCRGLAMGHLIRGKWLFWKFPLTRYHLSLARGRRIFNIIRFITVGVLIAVCWLWFGWFSYESKSHLVFIQLWKIDPLVGLKMFFNEPLFWVGALLVLYFQYRLIRQKQQVGLVERHSYQGDEGGSDRKIDDWKSAFKIRRARRINISESYTDEAKIVLANAYRFADRAGSTAIEPIHLFYTLLSFNRIANIFIRLSVPAKSIQSELGKLFPKAKNKSKNLLPLPSADFQQVIFQAYEEAFHAHQDYVSVTELLLAVVKQAPVLQDILFGLDINKQKLENVVEWVRIRERLYRQHQEFRKAAWRRSTKGMDRAMTAVQTPFLNQFSEDLTLMAQFGRLENCVARDKEIEEIFRVVDGGRENVILVGEHGVGKKSVMEGLAQKMVAEDVPPRLKDKRLVRISTSALLAGASPSGAVERLQNIMYEVARAKNIILFIHNIHDLIGVSAGAEGGLDVANAMAEHLSSRRFFTFATTSTDEYARNFANSALSGVFTKVEIKEMDENQAIQVLESKVGYAEYKNNVFFSYDAIAKAVQLSKRFIHDSCLPGSALEVMSETAVHTRNTKGANSLVTAEETGAVVAEKTHIPASTVSADESTKLINLETKMHERVIGQDEAVGMVASALRRARAEIRSQNKPIANFLFMGPTGVGKTELAKTIAQVYFGGEERMIRLDMSEYQDKSGIYRLLGAPGEKGSGILTEAVRQNPFALLLLDEIEKADKDILNLFLQVMDDGRLTDSVGRVADFTNVILIATTNAGTAYVTDKMREGLSSEAIKERLLHGELGQYFKPEFLNRFDGIVLFHGLDEDAIRKIAGLMLKRVAKDLEAKGIDLKVEEEALDFLAKVGFDPEFGARPMRRALQERVENKLADLILSGKLKRRDVVVIGAGGELRVE